VVLITATGAEGAGIRRIVNWSPSTTVALSGTHAQAALAAATEAADRLMRPIVAVAYDGLIEIEPRSELALIVCAELLLRCTVTVEVPTNVCVLIR